jgi:chromosome segregation ATPase
MAETEALFVHEVRWSNIMKLRHGAVQLREGMNRVLGENEAGKSTFLDLIRFAIGGAKELPGEVITRGEERAEIVLKFGGFVVERRFHKNEKGGEDSTLVLIGPDGDRLPKPQTVLEAFYDKYCFDPLEFMRMEPAKQVEVLKRLGNLKFGPLETARAKLYEQRTEVNSKGTAAKARYLAMPTPTKALPAELVNVDELLERQNAAQQVRLDNQAERSKLENLRRNVEVYTARVDGAKNEIARLERTLEAKRAELEREAADLVEHTDRFNAHQAKVAELKDPAMSDLIAAISAAQATNLAIERNRDREKLRAELDELKKLSDDLSAQIDALDAQKRDAIAAVKFPVEKLGFTDEAPTYDGLALAQASAAVQLRVSVAIGVALNSKLRLMLVRDAALMGTAQLELLKQLCVERRAQLIVEIAARDAKDLEVLIQEGDVVVVDGKVRVEGQEQLQLGGAA